MSHKSFGYEAGLLSAKTSFSRMLIEKEAHRFAERLLISTNEKNNEKLFFFRQQ